ncbi:unnamed protein product, partial [Closterium sp. Naga37s-1]
EGEGDVAKEQGEEGEEKREQAGKDQEAEGEGEGEDGAGSGGKRGGREGEGEKSEGEVEEEGEKRREERMGEREVGMKGAADREMPQSRAASEPALAGAEGASSVAAASAATAAAAHALLTHGNMAASSHASAAHESAAAALREGPESGEAAAAPSAEAAPMAEDTVAATAAAAASCHPQDVACAPPSPAFALPAAAPVVAAPGAAATASGTPGAAVVTAVVSGDNGSGDGVSGEGGSEDGAAGPRGVKRKAGGGEEGEESAGHAGGAGKGSGKSRRVGGEVLVGQGGGQDGAGGDSGTGGGSGAGGEKREQAGGEGDGGIGGAGVEKQVCGDPGESASAVGSGGNDIKMGGALSQDTLDASGREGVREGGGAVQEGVKEAAKEGGRVQSEAERRALELLARRGLGEADLKALGEMRLGVGGRRGRGRGRGGRGGSRGGGGMGRGGGREAREGGGGEFELLLRLPDDMRPQVPVNLHSRVPTPIRQVRPSARCAAPIRQPQRPSPSLYHLSPPSSPHFFPSSRVHPPSPPRRHVSLWVNHHLRAIPGSAIGRNDQTWAAIAAGVAAERALFTQAPNKRAYLSLYARALAAAPTNLNTSSSILSAVPAAAGAGSSARAALSPTKAAPSPTKAAGLAASVVDEARPISIADALARASVARALRATGLDGPTPPGSPKREEAGQDKGQQGKDGEGERAKVSMQGEQQGGEAEREAEIRRAAGKSTGAAVGDGGQKSEQGEQGRVEGAWQEGQEGPGERRQVGGGASVEALVEAVAAPGGGEGDAGEVLDGDCGASAGIREGGGTLGSEWSKGRHTSAPPLAATAFAVAVSADACGAGGSGSEGAGRGAVGEGGGGASSTAALPAGSPALPAGSTADSAQQGHGRKDPVLNQVHPYPFSFSSSPLSPRPPTPFLVSFLQSPPLSRLFFMTACPPCPAIHMPATLSCHPHACLTSAPPPPLPDAEQRRWVASKAAGKVMERHGGARSAAFLVKEGEDVWRLAERYLRTYHVRFSNGGNAPPTSSSPPAG